MKRRTFIQNSAVLGAGLFASKASFALMQTSFPTVRIPADKRLFSSKAIENAIVTFGKATNNKELAWLFGNCLPNTLDTTVFPYVENNRNYTYVITGDIDAMWLRDSSAQVWPYLAFMKDDKNLKI